MNVTGAGHRTTLSLFPRHQGPPLPTSFEEGVRIQLPTKANSRSSWHHSLSTELCRLISKDKHPLMPLRNCAQCLDSSKGSQCLNGAYYGHFSEIRKIQKIVNLSQTGNDCFCEFNHHPAKPPLCWESTLFYFGTLAQISVNLFTHVFSSQSCDSMKSQLGQERRRNVSGRPGSILHALASPEHWKVPYFKHFPGQKPPFHPRKHNYPVVIVHCA